MPPSVEPVVHDAESITEVEISITGLALTITLTAVGSPKHPKAVSATYNVVVPATVLEIPDAYGEPAPTIVVKLASLYQLIVPLPTDDVKSAIVFPTQ